MSRTHADADVVAGMDTFCREVLAPRAAEIDEKSLFATLHLPALAEMGVMGMNLPAEFGGPGIDPSTLFEAIALVAGACGSTAATACTRR